MKASFNFDRSSEYEFVEQAHHKFVESTSIHDKHAFVVGTNILWPFEEFSDAWTFLTHGPALTAMGHLFSKKINRVLISSTHAYGELIPWGSHPLTDPLLSSSNMAVEHVGAAFSRFDKVVTLAGYPAMLPHLSVCGLSPEKKAGAQNCSKCQKCLRTMAALDLCDVDPLVATSFDWRAYSASSLATTHLHHPNEYIFFEELASAARAAGRQDILTATSQAIRRSAKYKPLVFVENVVRRRFGAVSRMRSLKKMKQRFYSVVRR